MLLATREFDRVAVALVGQADASEQFQGFFVRLFGRTLEHLAWPFDDVLQHGHVRKQVETLEHHAGGQALAGDLRLVEFVQLVADDPVTHQFAVDPEAALVDFFQLVDAAQQSAFAGAGRADDAQHFALLDFDVDVLERVEMVVVLVQAHGLDDASHVGLLKNACRRRERNDAPDGFDQRTGR